MEQILIPMSLTAEALIHDQANHVDATVMWCMDDHRLKSGWDKVKHSHYFCSLSEDKKKGHKKHFVCWLVVTAITEVSQSLKVTNDRTILEVQHKRNKTFVFLK